MNEPPEIALRSDVVELDRQVERGSLFTQAALERSFRRIGDAESTLAELVRALDARGVVSAEELGFSMTPSDEADGSTDGPSDAEEPADDTSGAIGWPTIALRVDSQEQRTGPEVAVDCNARMPVCQAVCCKLKFPLSPAEVDAGVVKWDIGHPYVIRHDSTGHCIHNDRATGGCTVYEDRPGVCRRYSCANDSRIWKDFDGMVLNQEWLDENLVARDFHVRAVMPDMERID